MERRLTGKNNENQPDGGRLHAAGVAWAAPGDQRSLPGRARSAAAPPTCKVEGSIIVKDYERCQDQNWGLGLFHVRGNSTIVAYSLPAGDRWVHFSVEDREALAVGASRLTTGVVSPVSILHLRPNVNSRPLALPANPTLSAVIPTLKAAVVRRTLEDVPCSLLRLPASWSPEQDSDLVATLVHSRLDG